jgi:hypothetical protein
MVEFSRNKFFSDTAFALDENGEVRCRDACDSRPQLLHHRAPAHQHGRASAPPRINFGAMSSNGFSEAGALDVVAPVG